MNSSTTNFESKTPQKVASPDVETFAPSAEISSEKVYPDPQLSVYTRLLQIPGMWLLVFLALFLAYQVRVELAVMMISLIPWLTSSRRKARSVEFPKVTQIDFSDMFTSQDLERIFTEYFGTTPGTAGYHLMTKDPVSGKSPFTSSKIRMYEIAGHPELVLVLINGKSDGFIHKMAELFGMPSGFPTVVNIYTGEVIASGFYPKFANDDDQKTSFLVEANRAIKLIVLRKWSGYLTSTVLYKSYSGHIKCIVTLKKSADPNSPYVIGGQNLWRNILTQKALQEMWNFGIRTIWAETMTKEDQTHGTVVNEPRLVITAACMKITRNTIRPQIVSDERLAAVLKRVGLSQYAAVAIHIPEKYIEAFVKDLTANRDMMNEVQFQTLLRKYGLRSDSFHTRIVGNRLEGLILKFYFPDGTSKIEKYKFAGYTKVTMCARTCSGGGNPNSESKFSPLGTGQSNDWRPTLRYVRAIDSFVQRWVFTESTRSYYRGLMLAYGQIYDEILKSYDHKDPTAVGPWILAADALDQVVEMGAHIKRLTERELKDHVSNPVYLMVTVGPVGSGKTTASNIIAEILKIPHIDGDLLGFTLDLVLMLKSERNFTTMSQIALALASQGMAIVSAGGGALGSGWKTWEFTAIRTLENMLNVPVELIVLTPGESWQHGPPDMKKLELMHADKDSAYKTMESRMKRAGTKVNKNLCTKVSNISASNFKIVEQIVKATSVHVQFPHARGSNDMIKPSERFLQTFINKRVESSGIVISSINYKQKRGLFMVDEHKVDLSKELFRMLGKKNVRKLDTTCERRILHDTEAYEESFQEFDIEGKTNDNYSSREALRLTIFEIDEKSNATLAWTTIVLDEVDSHLTINAGNHKDYLMRTAARAYNDGSTTVTMLATITEGKGSERTSTDVNIQYPLREDTDRFVLIRTPVTVTFLTRIFIP